MRIRIWWFVAGVLAVVGLDGCGSSAPRFTAHERIDTTPREWPQHQLRGIASYYAEEFNGKATASGEVYDMYALTAAHRTLPFNTKLKVVDKENGRSVFVRINDRGPFKDNRVIDLSFEAAKELGIIGTGTAPVVLEIVELGTP